jgi:hypothetical protein
MRDAAYGRNGSRVTAGAADYHAAVPANGRLAFGFLASWRGRNPPPDDVTLNGLDRARA